MSVPVLEFVGVHAGYGNARVLNGMSFAVEEGECFALIGPNGVGKTTTCNALFGLASRSDGAILIDGREVDARVAHMAARYGASLVPQGRQIFTTLSIKDNLLLGGASRRSGPWTLDKLYKLFPVLSDKSSALGS
ncbi:MAG: ATP-binding cassette domain-containing protein, partial [Microbacterium sp.]|nr:ATP-binding cassette domain-containing protein [Microbacterium sp.]